MALVKAVPAIKQIFLTVVDLYYEEQVREIDAANITKDSEMDALHLAISKAETNGQRMAYAKTLNRLNSSN